MASQSIGLSGSGGGVSAGLSSGKSFDSSVIEATTTVAVGTVEESLSFVEVTLPAVVALNNADSTNFVEVGFDTGVYPLIMNPGFGCCFEVQSGVTVYLKADTAPCNVSRCIVKAT